MQKIIFTLSTLLSLACLSTSLDAQQLDGTKIDIPVATGEILRSSRLSPDGRYIVYTTDTAQSSSRRYYSVSTSGGGAAVRLNTDGAVVPNDLFSTLLFSPDSRRVLYTSGGVDRNLYSVPITGGSPVRLNQLAVGAGSVASFIRNIRFTDDGKKVVFEHTQQVRRYELFSNNINGGALGNLNVPSSDINDPFPTYEISADGSFVVYSPVTSASTDTHLFRTPVAGGVQPTRITPNGQSVGDFGPPRFLISPNGQRVIYAAKVGGGGDFSLFSLPSIGGAAVRLGELTARDQFGFAISISPDSANIIVSAPSAQSASVNELYRAPVGGGLVTTITSTSSSNQPRANRTAFFSDDGRHFFYTTNANKLYSYTVSSGVTTLLADNVSLNFAVEANDNERLMFVATDGGGGPRELYSVLKGGGGLLKLNRQLAGGENVQNLSFDFPRRSLPDTKNLVAFQVVNGDATEQDLFISSADQQDIIKVGQGFIQSFDVFDDSVLYLSDESSSGEFEWFKADLPAGFGDNSGDDLCIPIKADNEKLALVCL